MQQIPRSGYYFANKYACIALEFYEGVMGKNGLNAILNLAGLGRLIDNYPPDNLDRQFDFADFSALQIALDEMYGLRGGRGLAVRAGQAIFNNAHMNLGAMVELGDLALKDLSLQEKMRIWLPAAAQTFLQVSDQQISIQEKDESFVWTNLRCPFCWARTVADKPVCHISTGLLQAMLTWVFGGMEFRITESRCCAMGDLVCEHIILKDAISEEISNLHIESGDSFVGKSSN
jgi:hypothetical protein